MSNDGNPLNNTEARTAFIYGVTHDGFKVWNRTGLKYSEIDALDASPETKQALKDYHDTWYIIGVDLPETTGLVLLFAWYVYTGGLASGLKMIAGIFGLPT